MPIQQCHATEAYSLLFGSRRKQRGQSMTPVPLTDLKVKEYTARESIVLSRPVKLLYSGEQFWRSQY